MAVVCIQNGFLTVEDGDELASLRAVARGRNKSKTVGCCIGGTRFFTEEDDTEIIDKSGESATIDRLSMVLMSGKLLPDAGHDAAGTVVQESFEIMPHLDSAPSFERNHGLELFAEHYLSKVGRRLSWSDISTTADSDLWKDSPFSYATSERSSFCVEEQQDLVSITVPHKSYSDGSDYTEGSRHNFVSQNSDCADSCSTTDDDLPVIAAAAAKDKTRGKLEDMKESVMMVSGIKIDVEGEEPDEVPVLSRNKTYSHSQVPKGIDLTDTCSTIDDDDQPTTLMIRNIPNQYAQKDFAEEFDSLGFKGTYDFLYLPVDRKTYASVGYCFVNFIHPCWAAKCTTVLHNYMLKKQKGNKYKYAQVSVAHLQGLEANIAHYQDKGVTGGRGRLRGPMIVGGLSTLVLDQFCPVH